MSCCPLFRPLFRAALWTRQRRQQTTQRPAATTSCGLRFRIPTMSLCGLNRLDVSANLCAMCMLCIPSATIACELRAISSLCSSTGTREHKHVRGASSGFRYNIPHRRVGSEIVCEQGLSIPTRGSCQPRASTTVAEEPCASVHTSGINATRAMPCKATSTAKQCLCTPSLVPPAVSASSLLGSSCVSHILTQLEIGRAHV